MMKILLLAVGVVTLLLPVTESAAADKPLARHHHRHHHHVYVEPNPFAAPIAYDHNYGPGPYPGTFAFYDGPLSANCKQSAAAYRGQDGRRHPCH